MIYRFREQARSHIEMHSNVGATVRRFDLLAKGPLVSTQNSMLDTARRIGSERPQDYCRSSLRAASTPAALSLIGRFNECSPASLQVTCPW